MALRSESLYPTTKTEVANTSAEEPKPQASGEGKNHSQNKRKQNQTKDGQKKKNKKDIECFSCGKKGHYASDCRAKPGEKKCFNCDQVGHFKNQCPQPQKEKQIVKACAINAFFVECPNCGFIDIWERVSQGMLSIYDVLVQVLFDTGASHSFVSSDLVDRLELEPEIVDSKFL